MAPRRTRSEEPAHDVLAAEEFGVPAPDPRLHREPAHDILAAEEFGVPAPDPHLHRAPVELPADPTGIAEPHDVLAAEEFALPAPPAADDDLGAQRRSGAQRRPGGRPGPPRGLVVLGGALAVLALRRRARRRRG